MKDTEQIQNKIDELKEKKLKLEQSYEYLEGTDDEDMINHLAEMDIDIYVLDKNIRLLTWVLVG